MTFSLLNVILGVYVVHCGDEAMWWLICKTATFKWHLQISHSLHQQQFINQPEQGLKEKKDE